MWLVGFGVKSPRSMRPGRVFEKSLITLREAVTVTNYTVSPIATLALDSDAAYDCDHTSSLAMTEIP